MRTSSTWCILLLAPALAVQHGGPSSMLVSSTWASGRVSNLKDQRRIGASSSAALAVRGGAGAKLDRSPLGTLLLFVRAFFASLLDPTYGLAPARKAEGGEGGAAADADPFTKRAKAGLGRTSKVIDVNELEKMGGNGGKSRVKAITSAAEFNKAVKAAGSKLVVVDFFATWCGPCKQIAPKFAELSGSRKKVVFLKVDVDANRDLSAKYEVSSMPTFLYLKSGKVLEKQAGASIDAVKGKIDQFA